ncbi:hypothetical protein O9X99_02120 [Agrobacterium salinitolerans]|uniref:Uncharacterized protein n=1 Tax=Agrobacterium salinitolerans TaxID=1183413 RepID=A0ABY3BUY7_9HYPH|nr:MULTISPECIES: hypothetical protein [Agrobacterium]MCZ7890464.1 hypothetical protein [Agrobacterium salinitolerans]TRA96814.1 hypothetical protein EXN23_00835 [Agrobacterium salinitolerans]
MSPDQVALLKTFDGLYHETMSTLPDGWIGPLVDMLQAMRQLSLVEPVHPKIETWVALRMERTSTSGAVAFASPLLPPDQWSAGRAFTCLEALSAFGAAVKETCEKCGHPGQACQIGQMTFYLCDEHGSIARERLTAKVEAYEERIRFRGEVSVLFQEHSRVSLHVSDRNFSILRQALRDIKQIVDERGLAGKVHVTKIEDSEGQLFLSARYEKDVDPASNFEIEDIIHHAQWQSDQASLEANKERDDDA